MIIFGHNNFRMRNFTPTELGLPEAYNAYNIEIRQRYAHIFWIPLFPIGKIWGLRKHADGQLYEMPASVRQHVEQTVKVPAISIWAFTGLMLIGLIGLIGAISTYARQVQMKSAMEKVYADEYNMKMSYVNDPQRGDHYTFLNGSYDSKYFVVKTVEKDRIELEELDESYAEPKTFWLARTDLKKYLSEKMDRSFKGADLPGVNDGPYELSAVEHGSYEEQPVLRVIDDKGKGATGAQEAKSR